MKRLRCVAFSCALFLFAGCGFEGIFDGNDKEVLAPVDLYVESGGSEMNVLYTEDFEMLKSVALKGIIEENHIESEEFAFVLNDWHFPREIEAGGRVYRLPDIDFSKYSLVLGRCAPGYGMDWYIKDQRAKVVFGKTKLYLHFVRHGNGTVAHTSLRPIVALYPKLPTGLAEVNCWMEDVVIPLSQEKL